MAALFFFFILNEVYSTCESPGSRRGRLRKDASDVFSLRRAPPPIREGLGRERGVVERRLKKRRCVFSRRSCKATRRREKQKNKKWQPPSKNVPLPPSAALPLHQPPYLGALSTLRRNRFLREGRPGRRRKQDGRLVAGSQLEGGCARPQVRESKSTCSAPLARCPYHGSTAER